MPSHPDLTVHIPAEYFPALAEIIQVGLERAKIDSSVRHELAAWWSVEKELATEHN
jgi:hypothetical protein